jgi:hypothetical protein
MANPYQAQTTLITTAKVFNTITPSDVTQYIPDMGLKALLVTGAGTVVLTDHAAHTVTFPVVQGQILYMAPLVVKATTTATLVGLFV